MLGYLVKLFVLQLYVKHFHKLRILSHFAFRDITLYSYASSENFREF